MRLAVENVLGISECSYERVYAWRTSGMLKVPRDPLDGEDCWDEWHVVAVIALMEVEAMQDEAIRNPSPWWHPRVRLSGWLKYPLNARLEGAWKLWGDDITLTPEGLVRPNDGEDIGSTMLAEHFRYVREELEPFDGETAF